MHRSRTRARRSNAKEKVSSRREPSETRRGASRARFRSTTRWITMNDDDRAVASVSVFYSGIRSTVYRCLIPSTVHFSFCLDVSETTPLRYTWGTRIPHYAPCDRLTKQKQPRAPRRDHCRRRVAIRRECASLDVSRVDSRRTRDASERFLRRRDARESTATLARRRDRGDTGRGCVNTHEGHARGRGRERTRERTSWRERATRRRASDCCARWTRGWRRRRARIGVGGEELRSSRRRVVARRRRRRTRARTGGGRIGTERRCEKSMMM